MTTADERKKSTRAALDRYFARAVQKICVTCKREGANLKHRGELYCSRECMRLGKWLRRGGNDA